MGKNRVAPGGARLSEASDSETETTTSEPESERSDVPDADRGEGSDLDDERKARVFGTSTAACLLPSEKNAARGGAGAATREHASRVHVNSPHPWLDWERIRSRAVFRGPHNLCQ